MLNLTQRIISDPKTPFLEKFQYLRQPDICLAENVNDFEQNSSNLPFPWYKIGTLNPYLISSPRAYVTIYNVHLYPAAIEIPEAEPGSYILKDATGLVVVYWFKNHPLFHCVTPPPEQFDNSAEWEMWHNVLLHYCIELKMAHVIDACRVPSPKRKQRKKLTLTERINLFFPDRVPLPRPA